MSAPRSKDVPACPKLALPALPVPKNASECWPRGISGDGATVVGQCVEAERGTTNFMVWTERTTSAEVRFGDSRRAVAEAASFDGSVVVGTDEQGPVRIGPAGVAVSMEVFSPSIS